MSRKLVAGKTFLLELNSSNCQLKLKEEHQLDEAIYLNIGLENDNFLSYFYYLDGIILKALK